MAIGVALAASPTAAADDVPAEWNYSRYDVDATIDSAGVAKVTLDIELDYGNRPGHGPYLVFINRMRVPDDPDHWFEISTHLDSITSPSGADTSVKEDQNSNTIGYRIGDEDRAFRGKQHYVVKLTIHGIVDTKNEESNLDEVNWTAIGNSGNIPINNATVTLRTPRAPQQAACFTGPAFNQSCSSTIDGEVATFSHNHLPVGSGMQVVAGYPVETFTSQADPFLIRRTHLGNAFPLDPANIAGGAAVAALSAWGLIAIQRRFGRDQSYAGVTPGLTPTDDTKAKVTSGRTKGAVAVQFSPPAGVRPGELGVIMDTKSDTRDVTATLIDLAVRGHVVIEKIGDKDWVFHRQPPTDHLEGYEVQLLNGLAPVGRSVTTRELRDEAYGQVLHKTHQVLYRDVKRKGWFRTNPVTAKLGWLVGGVVAAGVGVALTINLALFGYGWIGVPLVIAGVILAIMSFFFSGRSAEGSAVLAQGKGFELYLKTAEADQLRWEEGQDIFSRYLPFAITFDCAKRWTRLFQQLEAQGRYSFNDLGWYYGYGYGYNIAAISDLGADMAGLASSIGDSMRSAQIAAASSSVGSGSGFSGGGGFGGGGSGAW